LLLFLLSLQSACYSAVVCASAECQRSVICYAVCYGKVSAFVIKLPPSAIVNDDCNKEAVFVKVPFMIRLPEPEKAFELVSRCVDR
jgi:hypothetical protein